MYLVSWVRAGRGVSSPVWAKTHPLAQSNHLLLPSLPPSEEGKQERKTKALGRVERGRDRGARWALATNQMNVHKS